MSGVKAIQGMSGLGKRNAVKLAQKTAQNAASAVNAAPTPITKKMFVQKADGSFIQVTEMPNSGDVFIQQGNGRLNVVMPKTSKLTRNYNNKLGKIEYELKLLGDPKAKHGDYDRWVLLRHKKHSLTQDYKAKLAKLESIELAKRDLARAEAAAKAAQDALPKTPQQQYKKAQEDLRKARKGLNEASGKPGSNQPNVKKPAAAATPAADKATPAATDTTKAADTAKDAAKPADANAANNTAKEEGKSFGWGAAGIGAAAGLAVAWIGSMFLGKKSDQRAA